LVAASGRETKADKDTPIVEPLCHFVEAPL